jgi:phospholipase C
MRHRRCHDGGDQGGGTVTDSQDHDAADDHGSRGPSRRGVLQAGAAAAAAAAAAGIGVAGRTPAADAAVARTARTAGAARTGRTARARRAEGMIREPGSLPYPDLPQGTDTLPQIQHVVVLMMENHSYDNKLGMLRRRGADGFRLDRFKRPGETNPYKNGDRQLAFHMPTTCQPKGHPSQNWMDSHTQFANGLNNGFVKSGSGPLAMGYWDGADQPFYYSMARKFPIADRYFCSLLGQTDPNRRYLISATSMGMVNDVETAAVLSQYPANGTIFDTLDAAKLTWKDYYTTLPTAALYLRLVEEQGKNIVSISEFFKDAKNGKLPFYSLVEPNYETQSEEDPQNVAVGEQFAASVIDAVMKGPGWKHTMLIWNYDEHGGYYDHVPPPVALAPDDIPPAVPAGESVYDGFARYGFRVPCAVISPYSRPNYVSHKVMDHTSICALVEAKWNLPALTFRDANAWPMLDMINVHHAAFLHPPKLAKPLLETKERAHALVCDRTGPGKIPPKGSVKPPRK